jgi:GntR family transcriptional regulator, transcriptional repressor for pyruvate dehydrogenase complex
MKPSLSDADLLTVVQPLPRKGLAQAVSDQLLELIASSSESSPKIPTERILSEQLGVSRNVLREALAGLDRLGVLGKVGNKRFGDTARARAQLLAHLPPDATGLDRFMGPIEARRMLEPEIAARAATISTRETVSEIKRWLTLMEEGERRGERVVEYDSAFHVSIARATRNPTLVTLVAALTDASRDAREASFKPPTAVGTYLEDHRAILRAIRGRDSDGARSAMAVHLGAVADLARAALTDDRSRLETD